MLASATEAAEARWWIEWSATHRASDPPGWRRLKLADVLLYREVDQARRLDAVNPLAAEAQELGIY